MLIEKHNKHRAETTVPNFEALPGVGRKNSRCSVKYCFWATDDGGRYRIFFVFLGNGVRD